MTAPDPLSTPSRIAIAGDWHGHTRWAQRMIELAQQKRVQTILHVGDFGLWPGGDSYLNAVERELRNRNTVLLWVDGNHEDHLRLAQAPIDEETGLHRIRDHVWHIPRGFRWTWNGIRFMGLGGAASVDEHGRTEWVNWWRGEVISCADVERATTNDEPVDVLIAHDCPEGVEIPTLRKTAHYGWPEDVLRKSHANRELLRRVVDVVTPRVVYHGHYHERYDAKLELGGPTTDRSVVRIVGLDCDGAAHDEQNMLIMNLEDVL